MIAIIILTYLISSIALIKYHANKYDELKTLFKFINKYFGMVGLRIAFVYILIPLLLYQFYLWNFIYCKDEYTELGNQKN